MLGLSIISPPKAEPESRALSVVGGSVGFRSGPAPATRATGATSYTDLIVDATIARLGGRVGGARPAAVELAGRLVGRAMSVARVTGAPALTPSVMQMIGRSIVTRGESLHAVYFTSPDLLVPASNWDIEGGPARPSWIYHVDLIGPSVQAGRERMAANGVLHVIIDPPASQPWRGTTPSTTELGRLAEQAALAVLAELHVPAARVVPQPAGTKSDDLLKIVADLREGKLSFPPTTKASAATGAGGAPAQDWVPRRIGPEPDAAQVAAHTDAEARLSAALGVHPSYLSPQATAGAMREARRQFQVDVLEPYAAAVEEAARFVWGGRVKIDFPIRSDVVGIMAKAAETLVRLGCTKEEAMVMAGFGR